MASITLHRASRILEAIQSRALKVSAPKVSVRISVFADDPAAELEARQAECREALEATRRLLRIRGELRAAVDMANAQCGVFPLLRAKNAADDLVAVLERIPGVAAEQRPEGEDDLIYRRRPKKAPPPPILDVKATLAMIGATKARYLAAEAAATEVEVSTVDAAASRDARQMAAGARREADRIAEELRALNAANRIEVSDADLDWLATHEVV